MTWDEEQIAFAIEDRLAEVATEQRDLRKALDVLAAADQSLEPRQNVTRQETRNDPQGVIERLTPASARPWEDPALHVPDPSEPGTPGNDDDRHTIE